MLGELEKIRVQVIELKCRVGDMQGVTFGSEHTAWRNMFMNLEDVLYGIDIAQDLAYDYHLCLPPRGAESA